MKTIHTEKILLISLFIMFYQADAILAVMDNEALFTSLSRRAAGSVREKFGFDQQVSNLETIYEDSVRRFQSTLKSDSTS